MAFAVPGLLVPGKAKAAVRTGISWSLRYDLSWSRSRQFERVPVADGPVRRPLWTPRRDIRVTYNGLNFVRVMTNPPQKNLISPSNPEGLLPGGASALGDYRVGRTIKIGRAHV